MTSAGDPATVVGVGLAVLLALGTGMWKAASLRGDLNRSWSKRVDAATVALTDRAIDELRELRAETDRLLGKTDRLRGDEKDPSPTLLAAADPAPLIRRAEAVAQYNRTSNRLRAHLDRLLRVAPYIAPALIVAAVGVIAVTVFYADITDSRWLRIVGWAVTATGAIVLGGLFGSYLLAQHRLSGAEILADRPPLEEAEDESGWDPS